MDTRGARRLVFALLLLAVREAAKGNLKARQWVYSAEAAHWAGLVELEGWPPKPGMWRDSTLKTA